MTVVTLTLVCKEVSDLETETISHMKGPLAPLVGPEFNLVIPLVRPS